MAPVIGIDLGTTNSCVAVYRDGRVEIIPNGEGERLTPSVVSFGAERLVGQAARDREALDPQNTVYEVKRLIGRRFKDKEVQDDVKNWQYKVVEEESKPKISVQYRGAEKTFFPEEISAIVLQTLKEAASAYLGCEVRDAVVTVPAYFNNSQRQATIDAAAIAGLNVLRIVNEPTAGALAYGIGSKDDGVERNVLIFDFGGGTFDVSVLTIDCGIFEVKSTAGNTHLGGSDLDSRLVDHFADRFEQLHKRSLRGSPKAMRRLRTACELVKRRLSTATEASAELHALDGVDFQVKLTRARFDDLCADLFKATLDTVREALGGAGFEKGQIHDVVLVGGSTRIPAVRKLLQDFFDGITLKHTVHPDEAVAAGAAIQADMQTKNETGLDILDVTPLSLGVLVKGGLTCVIIKRNSMIPCKKSETFYTMFDNQTEILERVLEGERAMAKDNNLLGEFTLSGIAPRPAGESSVIVTFDIDHNSILKVTAVDKSNHSNSNSLTVTNYEGRWTEDKINDMIAKAEAMKEGDIKRKEAALARVALEKFCLDATKRLKNKDDVAPSTKNKLLKRITETMQWAVFAEDASKADAERKQQELDLALSMTLMSM